MPYSDNITEQHILTVNKIYMAMMNICTALFHIFGANHLYIHPITNIFRVNDK